MAFGRAMVRKSSGTTNDKSKFLPVTPEILKGCHYKGGFDTVSIYLQNNPDSHFFASKGLILGGSHSPSPLNRNAHCGDLSAVLLQNLNPLVNLIRVPDKKIILMDEWEKQDQGDCRKHLENRREQPIRCSLMDAGTNQGRITKDRKRIPDGCLAQHGGILPRRDQFRAVPGTNTKR